MKKIAQICTILLGLATNSHASEITHDFKVFIGPFEASHTTFSYNLTPTSYKVQSDIKTYGFFNTLYPFSAKAIAVASPIPEVAPVTIAFIAIVNCVCNVVKLFLIFGKGTKKLLLCTML